MSKINQIEKGLLELSGGAFQKLADAYLHKNGYEQINPLGSVIGSDKTRTGTPDTLIPLPNNKYVFAEYTTQEQNVYDKIEGDLNKCLDETKTGVPVDKIDEVVFCHTSVLTGEKENKLAQICQARNVNLSIFGIGRISFDLYQKYPRLARDFLGVEVDTGQILSIDEFVAAYDKNKLATKLSTAFHFRGEELKQVESALQDNDLIIVSGRAGVGKTRFALESCMRFKNAHTEYKIFCIFDLKIDLFQDIRDYFSESGSFLIFVDDANRVSRFEYFIQLIQNQRHDQQIKIIATVRDYALRKVQLEASKLKRVFELQLQELDEGQIKELIRDEYSINNHLYLDRIAEIAQGNSRLAIMAAEVAKRENTLQSISDVSALYDEYFVSIRHDLEDLSDDTVIQTAGIVVFFRAIDRSNIQMLSEIERAFNITLEQLWVAAHQLHELEVLDMYEDEVVRISDQVLGTYLFYYAFFKKKVLDFSALLEYFFPFHRQTLIDAVNPALNAFDSQGIMDIMRPHVDRAWQSMQDASDKKGLLHLMDVFWFLKQTDTLLHVKNEIEGLEPPKQISLSDLEFKSDSNIQSPSLLSVLGSFRYSDESRVKIALGLLLDFVEKQPSEMGRVLYQLMDRFGFEPDSYIHGFFVQKAVIELLAERIENGNQELFSRIFIEVGKSYLHTRFHSHKSKDRRTITWIDFQLSSTPALQQLRQHIWRHLFQLHKQSNYQEVVFDVLLNYCTSGMMIAVDKIIAEDSVEILELINSELDASRFRNCRFVHQYLDFLEDHGLLFDSKLRNKFTTDTYKLSNVLLYDWAEKRNLALGYNEYKKVKKEQIEQHFAEYGFAEYKRFFQQCLEIDLDLDKNHDSFLFVNGLSEVLLTLADRDPKLYSKVLEYYLHLGDPLKLGSVPLLQRLLAVLGVSRVFEIIHNEDFQTKKHWQFGYYISLEQGDVKAEHLNQLYILYNEASCRELPHGLDFLLKFRSIDKKVVAKVTDIILAKGQTDPHCVNAFSLLFNPHSEVNKIITDLFSGDTNLLKKAYFAILDTNGHQDHDGQTFARILDIDPDFILEYIDKIFADRQSRWISKYDDTRDYSFLWLRDDYESLMTGVAEYLYDKEKELWGTYMITFFGVRENGKNTDQNSEIVARQDLVLEKLIKKNNQDSDFMTFVFGTIVEFPPEKRRRFIALFLSQNKKYEDFKRLSLEPSTKSYSGSAVPALQEDVDYYESLLPLLDGVEFLQHKQFLERTIQRLHSQIEYEKKRDFIEDWG